ncbi:MAG: MFS transporter [Planctomycetes bacterium]|nr:MFS transporter [Planctomycetota bacterium]
MSAPTATRTWLGLAAFYAALFAVLGVFMQYFPLWLHDERGLDEAQIAVVLSSMTVARTVAGPLWAQQVDRTGQPRRVLLLLCALSLAAFLIYHFADSVFGLMTASFVFGCCYPPMHPITDAFASATARREGFAYGRLRMVGSVTFLAMVLGVGYWLEHSSSSALFGLLLVGLVLLLATAVGLPNGPPPPPRVTDKAPMLELLRSKPFLLLMLAAAIVQGSHAPYYNLSTLHWQAHGIAKSTAGVLWAEGVLAEIVLFWFARGSTDRLRPTTLLALGGGAAVVRWTVLGLTTEVGWLFASNWLHALTFTCTYLGSLRALDRRVHPSQRATAQGLLGAATSGVGMVAGSLLGGFLYDRFAGGAFFAMALWGLIGIMLALRLRRLADSNQMDVDASTESRPA